MIKTDILFKTWWNIFIHNVLNYTCGYSEDSISSLSGFFYQSGKHLSTQTHIPYPQDHDSSLYTIYGILKVWLPGSNSGWERCQWFMLLCFTAISLTICQTDLTSDLSCVIRSIIWDVTLQPFGEIRYCVLQPWVVLSNELNFHNPTFVTFINSPIKQWWTSIFCFKKIF